MARRSLSLSLLGKLVVRILYDFSPNEQLSNTHNRNPQTPQRASSFVSREKKKKKKRKDHTRRRRVFCVLLGKQREREREEEEEEEEER